jgi:hypothetical protein
MDHGVLIISDVLKIIIFGPAAGLVLGFIIRTIEHIGYMRR